jgi:CubicO group peptidase (beta-lactamase class C family)
MKTLMILTLVAWFSIPAHSNTARDIRHDLDQYLQRITARGFSGAILVAKNGRVILSKGYGKLGPRGGAVTPTPSSTSHP